MYIQDGGHGGSDPGATSKGNVEKVHTLEASLYVNDRLNQLGVKSNITREGDITLQNKDRTDKVSKYNYCISHHFNAGGGSGTELIHSIYGNGEFERSVIEEFRKEGYPIRPMAVYSRKSSGGKDYYFMHRETGNCTTTIIEYDFVDGPQSEKIKDKAYRIGMYECLIKAICKRHNIEYKSNIVEDVKTDKLYRVQVGAYSVKENAEKLLQDLKSKGFQGVITETSVTTPPIPPKGETDIKSKCYKIGDAQIIETTPDNIYVKILGDTLDKSVGVNGVLFDTKTAPVGDPESCVFIAMNDGKALSNNSQFNGWNGPPRATLIYHTNNKLGFRQLKDITTIKDNTIWAVGGFMVKPYMDFKNEQIPPGVNYKTAHTYVGYDAEGKIYLIVKPNHMIADIVPLLNQLKITNAIVLDGGGSSQMDHPNGSFKSSRKINSAILLKEI